MTNMIEPSSPQKMGDEFKIGKSLFEEAKKRGFKKGVVATHLTDYSKKKNNNIEWLSILSK